MKKFIITSIFIFTISGLIAMEESTQSNWQKLPEEVKLQILSYLPEVGKEVKYEAPEVGKEVKIEAPDYKHWIRAMTVSKEFHSLLNDQQFLNDFAKRFASHNKMQALNFLTEAANHGDLALTKALIKAGPYLKEGIVYLLLNQRYTNEDFTTNEKFFDTLLQAGIDINSTISAKQSNGLMQALFKKDIDKAKWFLRNGIDLNYKDKNGKTITDLIREYPSYDISNNERKEWLDLIKQAEVEREKASNQK